MWTCAFRLEISRNIGNSKSSIFKTKVVFTWHHHPSSLWQETGLHHPVRDGARSTDPFLLPADDCFTARQKLAEALSSVIEPLCGG
jgi:hypothetical protein